jgi:hypothetical protein
MPLAGIKRDIDGAIFLPGIITEVKATGNTYESMTLDVELD